MSGGHVYTATDGRCRPPRDRQVSSLTVPCPACPAEVGEVCLTINGTPALAPHKPRRRMAVRLENETRT